MVSVPHSLEGIFRARRINRLSANGLNRFLSLACALSRLVTDVYSPRLHSLSSEILVFSLMMYQCPHGEGGDLLVDDWLFGVRYSEVNLDHDIDQSDITFMVGYKFHL